MKQFVLMIVLCGYFLFPAQAQTPKDGLDFFVSGEKLREARKYPQAIAAYNKALGLEPNNTKYMYNKCLCYHQAQRFEPARKCFEKMLEVDDKNTAVYEMIANIYKIQDKPEEAIAVYQKAYNAAPEDDIGTRFVYQFWIIEVLFREGRVDEAGEHIAIAQKLLPGTPDITHLEARYQNTLGDYQKALETITPVVEGLYGETGEGFAKYYFEMGYSLRKLGRHAEADSVLENAKFGAFEDNVEQLSAEYYYKIANAYYMVYEFDIAKALLDTAVAIKPDYQEAFDLKEKMLPVSLEGEIQEVNPETGFLERKKVDKTVILNKQLLKTRDPKKRADLYRRLCILYIKGDNFEDAVTAANECLAITPTNTLIIFYRGIAMYKMGDAVEGESVLYELSNSPKVSTKVRLMCYFGLALIQSQTNQYKLARLNLKKAMIGAFKPGAEYELRSVNLKERAAGN